ncbi:MULTISPECIES: hypothetical protein [unclassified Streptomyces]|uniref:hypothetical protein n=1 Tax=unclassified Streptomyces TaxID=2593676 RepID=UPI00332D753A
MDPLTLATGAVALLTPFLSRAAQDFAGAAGQSAWLKAEELLSRLRARFAGTEHEGTVEEFADGPQAHTQEMTDLLEAECERDAALREEIERLLNEVKRAAPHIVVVQRMKRMESQVGVRSKKMTRGDVSVTQESDHAVSGAAVDIDEIG